MSVALLAGCASEQIWADDAAVQAARYAPGGQPELVLVTSLNDRSGEGAHSALMVNGSELVMFDPAGNWDDPAAPERHDVRFGFTPQMQINYLHYQAYDHFHAVIQRVPVSAEVAERALQLVKANGAVPSAFCASATSGILRKLPGFEGVTSTMFPKNLMESFAELPGVRTQIYYGTPDPENPGATPAVSDVVLNALRATPPSAQNFTPIGYNGPLPN